ncbi:preprotein translocase subunit SecG [Butyrivibrio sp. XB500-5]|nr:preprotein translocase subunit SecG [Butyrivibrio sp. XB500-5]
MYFVSTLSYVVGIIFILVCLALVVLVLAQEGKNQGLGAIQGTVENTYWGKNRGRSREGILKTITVVLSVLFIVLSILLNMKLF